MRASKPRALAVATSGRASQLPEVPTMLELGYQDFDVSSWVAVLARKGTPMPIIGLINSEPNKTLRNPEVRSKLASISAEPEGGPPERLTQHIKLDLGLWVQVIRTGNIKVD